MLTEIHPDHWVDLAAIRAVTIRHIDRRDPRDPLRAIAVFFGDSENTLKFDADPKKVLEIINGNAAYLIKTRQA